MDGVVCLYPRLAVNLAVGPVLQQTYSSFALLQEYRSIHMHMEYVPVQAQSKVINPASHFRTELTKKDRCRAGPM